MIRLPSSLDPKQAILLSRPSDIQYLSGFRHNFIQERLALLYLSHQANTLLLQHFLSPPKNFSHTIYFGTRPKQIADFISQQKIEELFVDADNLTLAEFQALQGLTNLKISNLDREFLDQQRLIKKDYEKSAIRQAVRITKRAIAATIANLKIGQSELQIKQTLEAYFRSQGAEMAFDSIIAFDANSALPHHQPGSKRLRDNSVVLIDCGAKYKGYCGDVTRTVFFKSEPKSPATKKEKLFKHVLKIVKKAHQNARTLLENDQIKVKDLDLACRDYITQQGFGANFIHTTGHGLGLDIHEPPSIYQNNEQILQKNMVITIEPGIYLEGKFGVRWEDTVIV
jgi:Xaa-Pro aminopeptidase